MAVGFVATRELCANASEAMGKNRNAPWTWFAGASVPFGIYAFWSA